MCVGWGVNYVDAEGRVGGGRRGQWLSYREVPIVTEGKGKNLLEVAGGVGGGICTWLPHTTVTEPWPPPPFSWKYLDVPLSLWSSPRRELKAAKCAVPNEGWDARVDQSNGPFHTVFTHAVTAALPVKPAEYGRSYSPILVILWTSCSDCGVRFPPSSPPSLSESEVVVETTVASSFSVQWLDLLNAGDDARRPHLVPITPTVLAGGLVGRLPQKSAEQRPHHC